MIKMGTYCYKFKERIIWQKVTVDKRLKSPSWVDSMASKMSAQKICNVSAKKIKPQQTKSLVSWITSSTILQVSLHCLFHLTFYFHAHVYSTIQVLFQTYIFQFSIIWPCFFLFQKQNFCKVHQPKLKNEETGNGPFLIFCIWCPLFGSLITKFCYVWPLWRHLFCG